MDLIPDFCKRKHGEVRLSRSAHRGILSETYGIMVYQEQVMQMAQIIGGYSLGGADCCAGDGQEEGRGDGQAPRMFREGAAKNGLTGQGRRDLRLDGKVRRLRLQQVARGRLRAAVLSHRLAEGAPPAVHGANMSLAMDDTDKVKILVEDSIDICKLTILPPDINKSDYRFMPVGEPGKKATQIRYGLGAVKGAGQNAIEAILAARKSGPSRTCSISASAWTRSRSTAAPSNR
jgi:DNA polymerase-3 subunit alpha